MSSRVQNSTQIGSIVGEFRRQFGERRSRLQYLISAGMKAHLRRAYKAKELKSVSLSDQLPSSKFVVVLLVRNEAVRIPHLLGYYKDMGFDHFIIVDNGSTDNLQDVISGRSDVSLFRSDGDYKSARFGVDWVNAILSQHCVGKWVLHVDADEYLVFPFMDEINISALAAALEASKLQSLQCILVDMYSSNPIASNNLDSGQDPLEVCNLFDKEGYKGWYNNLSNTTFIKGGVRFRMYFDDIHLSPALNKTPLVLWKKHYAFVKSAHELWPPALNGHFKPDTPIRGALLHFKFTSDLSTKIRVESVRKQHTDEYDAYAGIAEEASEIAVGPQTARYDGWRSLVDCGLISCLPRLGRASPAESA